MEVARTKKKSKTKKKAKKVAVTEEELTEDHAVETEEEVVVSREPSSQLASEGIPILPPVAPEEVTVDDDPMQEFRPPPVIDTSNTHPGGDLILFDSVTAPISAASTSIQGSSDEEYKDATDEIAEASDSQQLVLPTTVSTEPVASSNDLTTADHAATSPNETVNLATPPKETAVLATPPKETAVLATPPKITDVLATSPKETVALATTLSETVNLATLPKETAVLATPPKETAVLATPPKETAALATPSIELGTTSDKKTTVEVPVTPLSEQCVADTVPTAPQLLYPTLDSLTFATPDVESIVIPYSEDDLALLYSNPQLTANPDFIDNFLKESRHDNLTSHPLYELLNQYLKARLSSKAAEGKVENLKKRYSDNQAAIWNIEMKTISSNGRCVDGTKVSHSHTHKYAQLDNSAVGRTGECLKLLSNTFRDEYSMLSYSAQLARIHVEFYIHQLLQSLPELIGLSPAAPVSGYIPDVPPGLPDQYTAHLRSCISVLFSFERRPLKDEQFSTDCRFWLNTLISALLRVASLPDHLFILNHLLRCPPGVCQWAISYMQPLSPLHYHGTMRHEQHVATGSSSLECSLDWKLSSQMHQGNGPIIDHWVTMLATLFEPIIGRDEFLSLFVAPPTLSSDGTRQTSQPWTFVEEDDDEVESTTDMPHLMLKESDYISFLDQFPVSDVFRYILGVKDDCHYSVQYTTSCQMLQFMAFCTCLIRLFGRVFTYLRQASYKEFIKQVGRTIRQIVHYVADHWCQYKTIRLAAGETMNDLPSGEDPMMRYSLQRLQVEFDQFVLRATQWILTAHKLGAWQFMADMPYGSLSLMTVWKILWTLYHYQLNNRRGTGTSERRGSVLAEREDLDHIPESSEDIIQSVRDSFCHGQFVDVIMKTYTSEAVFLLTTFVNMARCRSGNEPEEQTFINFIAQEIFQFTQVEEYAREAYSRTGHSLLGSIATVHPFVITTLMEETRREIDRVGENCILLFKELPLHLWLPTEADMSLVRQWLVFSPLQSSEHLIAKVIVSGLNWGVKDDENSSSPKLILSPSLHRDMALSLVDAWSRHLSSQPGGLDYSPPGSTISKYASSIRSLLSSDQSDLSSWMWEVVLMLKLHPSQLSLLSVIPPSPSVTKKTSNRQDAAAPSAPLPPPTGAKDASVYKQGPSHDAPFFDRELPQLNDTSVNNFEMLRDSVLREGLLSYYVSLSISSIGSDPMEFIIRGLPMLQKLVEQGYYLPVLKVLGNVTPMMFNNRKMFLNEQSFVQLVLSVVNADTNQASLKERLTWSVPSPLIVRRFTALITVQLCHYAKSPAEAEQIMIFWLETLLSIPTWLREPNVLYVLNNLCLVAFGSQNLEKILCETFLEQYKLLQPLQQKNKKLISSVTSSVLSIVGQDGGPPSLFSAITVSEYPWLGYYILCSEQQFEDHEGVWQALLQQLKKDEKISVDNALKKALTSLGFGGSAFTASHLCIYRWAELCTTVDTTFILLPLIWQRFFSLYLQRAVLSNGMPERGSLGLRFFSSGRSQSLRKSMKTTLSSLCRNLDQEMVSLKPGTEIHQEKEHAVLVEFLPKLLKFYKTLRLWLEEPRLHEEALYLPSLPPQYEPNWLARIFQIKQDDWVEFLRVWEVEIIVKAMTNEWKQVAAYQKPLPSQSESHDHSPDTATARIEKRLRYRTTPVSPPSFACPPAPFSLLPLNVLLSKDDLLSSIMADIGYIAQQGRLYSERINSLVALDSEYISGIVDLYSNQPRQFHVSVPCRKKQALCTGPATIVFRFDELTAHPHWEQRIPQNRQEQSELVRILSHPTPIDFCKAVARTEHVVGELSKLSEKSDNEALSSGVALFYEVLKFITSETKQFPPSCQFLTSCIEILGQQFIQRDPSQTQTILQLLLTQRSLGGLLAPLFDPNLCPPAFISMFCSVCEIAVKEGPTTAFSVLTKFNISKWLADYNPSSSDCQKLLEHVFQGMTYCGHDPSNDMLMLLEGYLSALVKLVEHQFPLLFNKTLQLIIDGTDTAAVSPRCWQKLSEVTTPPSSTHADSCRLGLQSLEECIQYLATFYAQKRLYTKEPLYELVSHDYISVIMQFIRMLSSSLITKYSTSVEVENTTSQEALNRCWLIIVDLFRPWLFPLHTGESDDVLFPCGLESAAVFGQNFKVFIDILCLLETHFQAGSTLAVLWPFYYNDLALPNTPDHVLQCYHTQLVFLPWHQYIPDLPAMDLMMKLKLNSSFSKASFVFLGDLFPLFNWKSIAEQYCASSDTALPIQFHITLLQLLIMLAAEPQVMNKKESRVPELLSEAKSYALHYIDLKTYQDILHWQKENCHPAAVLQTGSALSSALRLLKAAGSFPISSDSHPLLLHKDGWEKRYSFMRLLVELVASASQQKETHNSSYADIINFMLQTILDTVVCEAGDSSATYPVFLIQEVLNLFNVCHPSETLVASLVSHINACLDQLPNAHLLHLPTVTAASRILVSIPLMVKLTEETIKTYFTHFTVPEVKTLQLPNKADGYGWAPLCNSLSVPDTAHQEFSSVCVQEFACLCLNTHLLQQLYKCTSLAQELDIIKRIVQCCSSLKPKPNEGYKMFLIWEKAFNLLLRQIKFGGNMNVALTHFTTLATLLQRFGEDKATEGLLGAIGLGRKSSYTLEFRLISRVLATFIHCQMPLDGSQSVIPRLAPNAPGHVKDPSRHQTGNLAVAMATKQADQACAGLESLLSNKTYLHLRDYIVYSLDMTNDLQCTLMNINELFVYLVSNLYPSERCLDALRVFQA